MDNERAFQVFLTLLHHDPLASQRFTEIETRFEQLAGLAHSAVERFQAVERDWSPETRELIQRSFERKANYQPQPAVPARLKNAGEPRPLEPLAPQPAAPGASIELDF